MCGINGIVKLGPGNLDKEIKAMNKALEHRGNDDSGCWTRKNSRYGLALGHQRLSILDLSQKGHQPMGVKLLAGRQSELVCQDKDLGKADYVIVFNGEIYNFQQIKKELKAMGWNIESRADTEIFLKAYVEWGAKALGKLNGMWSLAIYDKPKNILFLSRDRLGVKPLLYFHKENEFYFSSEINAIKRLKKLSVDETAAYDFFTYNYIPSPKTFYKNLRKLEAGHYLIFDCLNCKFEIKKYWSLSFQEKSKFNYKKLNKLINLAIKERLKADVPMGVLLSGGLDSQSIAYFLKHNSFDFKGINLSFGPLDKETEAVKKSVRDFSYRIDFIDIKQQINQEDLDRLIKHYGEPFGDNSSVPTYFVMKHGKKNGYKVLLGGDGGDELFFGYKKYKILYFLKAFNILFPLKIRQLLFGTPWRFFTCQNILPIKIRKILLLLSLSWLEQFLKLSGGFVNAEKEFILPPKFLNAFKNYDSYWHLNKYYDNNLSLVKRTQKLDINTYLTNYILVKADMMSMLNTLELRSPFLDYRLYEYFARLKSNSIFQGLKTKKILKKIMKGKLPPYILKKRKTGFGWRNMQIQDFDLNQEFYLKNNNKIYTKLAYDAFSENQEKIL